MTSDLRDTVRDLYAVLESHYNGTPDGGTWAGHVSVMVLCRNGLQTILAARQGPTGFVRLDVADAEPVWLSPGAVAILREGLGEMPDPSARLDPATHARLTAEVARLQARETELQADCSRHEREARIARARAEYWEAVCDEVAADADWSMATSNDECLDAVAARSRAQTAKARALATLTEYRVDPQGRPLP